MASRTGTWLAGLTLGIAGTLALAQSDTTFTYQGQLQSAGQPVDADADFRFRLYESLVGGNQIGGELALDAIIVSDGLFDVALDFGADALSGQRWLEIDVRSPHDPGDIEPFTTLSPRQPLTPSPFSIQTRGIFVDENNNVGIGTTDPQAKLHIDDSPGQPAIRAATNWYAIRGTKLGNGTFPGLWGDTDSQSNGATGIRGYVNSTSPGASSSGVRGINNGTGANGIGVYGSQAGSGWGVYGTTPGGVGVYGESETGTGVRGISNSPGGYGGIFGDIDGPGKGLLVASESHLLGKVGIGTTTPFGKLDVVSNDFRTISAHNTGPSAETTSVWGECDSTNGRGVYGFATATSGDNIGVLGTCNSNSGIGVSGFASATSGGGVAVRGQCDSFSGFDFFAGGDGLNYGADSSRRWKSNIRNIDDPLDKIAQLRGVYFDWDKDHGGHHDLGMIAEEVGEVMPEIVNYEENGIDAIGMDYSKMTPLLVEAVNALRSETDKRQILTSERIASTERKNALLRAENESLRTRLAQLEQVVTSLVEQNEKENTQ